MPNAPKRHKPSQARKEPAQRESAAKRGYGRLWRRESKRWLELHPLCAECERQGRVTAATLVDHVMPHRGNMALFWDVETNWQSMCKPCHDAKTALGE